MAEHLTTTPSGIEIVFEDGLPDPATGKRKRRSYTAGGVKYPSVTTITGVMDKPGLQYGAEKLTMAAAIELAKDGIPLEQLDVDQALAVAGKDEYQLRFRQIWDRAADLGTEMHELPLETWLPEAEVLQNEVMVASPHHSFAGRFDYLVQLRGKTVRLDLKTSTKIDRYADGRAKAPYHEHIAQLGGYEIAATECGYPTADLHAVLRVTHDGDQDLYLFRPHPALFLAALQLYNARRASCPRFSQDGMLDYIVRDRIPEQETK